MNLSDEEKEVQQLKRFESLTGRRKGLLNRLASIYIQLARESSEDEFFEQLLMNNDYLYPLSLDEMAAEWTAVAEGECRKRLPSPDSKRTNNEIGKKEKGFLNIKRIALTPKRKELLYSLGSLYADIADICSEDEAYNEILVDNNDLYPLSLDEMSLQWIAIVEDQ